MALRADDVDLGRDRDLVERYQAGDPEAFDDLYRRYFDRLHRFCMRHTSDAHEAEEVAQEAFVKALRSMHSLTGERRFYPWMTVIAKRISIDRHRKLSRLELTDEPDLGSVEADIDHLFDAVDAGHVRDAMARVGPRHREVLLLREAQGLSYADIADRMDVPVTTVEALLHRARKALRREYAAVTEPVPAGLLGLPVLGWLATRAGKVRRLLADRWVEVAAVAAPAAVAAVTAAVVVLPDAAPPEADVAAARTVEQLDAAALPVEPSAPVDLGAIAGTAPTAAAADAPDATAPDAPADPAIEAGPVDVFVGPEGTDRARDEAADMPLGGEVGPAAGGVDPPLTAEDVGAFLRGALEAVLGPADDDAPASDADPDPLLPSLSGDDDR